MEENNIKREPGTSVADKKYNIIIDSKGPYFVYGQPELKQEYIVQDEEGISWNYRDGQKFTITDEPVALCRCGSSENAPLCDGTHSMIEWDYSLKEEKDTLLEEAEIYDGPNLKLADNPKYCVHARICMAKGTIWRLLEKTDKKETKEITKHEAFLCPSGRLKLIDKKSRDFIEPNLKPSISLIEDPQKKCSGPLWVKGGIPIQDSECNFYEVRNRVTLCRCGHSHIKPYCDGAHIEVKYQDKIK
ncbi:MAG: CDGSH iron-sulfur domain-containing protein, partial [Odoribacter sp.]|nr:CDGSH iron-sulfur domain-containing protein [Odoribacter sp.]